jgi:hypothetical protein
MRKDCEWLSKNEANTQAVWLQNIDF